MTKTKEQLKPNYAPLYAAALYPELAKVCQQHGYALAVHGSMANDFDLVAIPWTKKVSTPRTVLKAIKKRFAVQFIGRATRREHGRLVYWMSVGFGNCAIDFSFFPDL